MIELPNPWITESAGAVSPPVDTAAALVSPAPCDAAAVPLPEPSVGAGVLERLDDGFYPRGFDVVAFMLAIEEPMPMFIRAPREEYLDALQRLAAA